MILRQEDDSPRNNLTLFSDDSEESRVNPLVSDYVTLVSGWPKNKNDASRIWTYALIEEQIVKWIQICRRNHLAIAPLNQGEHIKSIIQRVIRNPQNVLELR